MDPFQAIRIRALKAVLHPDSDYLIRKVHRWYSKTFHTPIHEVEEIPLEDLYQAFFEEKYEEMSEQERETERQDLLLSDEERQARLSAEEAEEAELYEMSQIVAAEEKAKAVEEQKALREKKLTETAPRLGPVVPVEMPESDLPTGTPAAIPPNITMTFIDESTFEAEIEGFGAMTQPGKKAP